MKKESPNNKLYRIAFELSCQELYFCDRYKNPLSAKGSLLQKAKKKLDAKKNKH
jgi:hypothetical protein